MRSRGGLRIASFRGIDLRVHISLLFLLAYVVLVARFQFPSIALRSGIDPMDLSGGPLVWALLFALGLFASVALHEFGHALMAQAQGVRVHGITLMMLGGVSEMEKIPDKPYAEFKLAVVGPLVSLAIAGALHYGGPLFDGAETHFFAYWLSRANLVLAIFNLLPAFPLDGGRALRSLLGARLGHARATELAVRTSKGFAWTLGILGALSFNLLLVLIAFFIHGAASAELFITRSRGWLRGLTVGEVSVRLEPLPPATPIAETVRRMLEYRATVLPLLAPGGAPTLAALADIRRLPRRLWSQLPISELAVEAPRAVRLNDALSDILPELASAPYEALPLIDEDGIPIGVIRYSDVKDVIALKSVTEMPEESRDRAA
ncbi:MAG: site-2 protease family protein [Oligoflexia bacterium]|nr:site-2 protease family protein [Oligoflexia bacterium]